MAIAQVKEAFFTPLQVAERVGIEPTIRLLELYQFVCFSGQGAYHLYLHKNRQLLMIETRAS